MTNDKNNHHPSSRSPGTRQFPIDEKEMAWVEIYMKVSPVLPQKYFVGFMLATGDEVDPQCLETDKKGSMFIEPSKEYWFPADGAEALTHLDGVNALFWRVVAKASEPRGYRRIVDAIDGSRALSSLSEDNCAFSGSSGAVDWSEGHESGEHAVYCAADGDSYSLGLKLDGDPAQLVDAIWVQPADEQADLTALPLVFAEVDSALELKAEDIAIDERYAYHYNPT